MVFISELKEKDGILQKEDNEETSEMEDSSGDEGSVSNQIHLRIDSVESEDSDDSTGEHAADDDSSDDDDDDDEEEERGDEENDDNNKDRISKSNIEHSEDRDKHLDSSAPENEKPSSMDVIKYVLDQAEKEAQNNQSIAVAKHLGLEYDLGSLLAEDTNELDFNLLRSSKEEYLKNLARDNTQLLINRIWQLPITRKETEIVAKLPPPTTKLPREKPIPKENPLTKWQQFALEKGIKKKKTSKVQWDETLQKWIPRWGYKRAKADAEKTWVIEEKQNDDPNVDPFTKRKEEKKERVAKNEYKRLKNIARAQKVQIPKGDKLFKEDALMGGEPSSGKSKKKKEKPPRVGFPTADKMNSVQLKQAITISKTSTASAGKFQHKLRNEKDARNVNAIMPVAKKRGVPFLKPEHERKANLDIIDSILNKKPKLDLDKAVNRHIHAEQKQRATEKAQNPKGKSRGKARKFNKGNPKGKGQGKVKAGNKGSKKSKITGKTR